MVRASDIVSVLLRIGELICACIVTGLLGTFFHYLSDAHAHASSRLIFLMSIAGISIVATFALSPPVKYTFWAFPFDFIMFVLWMVAFGLIVDLTGTAGCNSSWYWHTWGWYWGRWYRIPGTLPSQALVGTAGCAQWRAMLAFTFSGGCIWFTSGCLGLYRTIRRAEDRKTDDVGERSASLTFVHPDPLDSDPVGQPEKGITGGQHSVYPVPAA